MGPRGAKDSELSGSDWKLNYLSVGNVSFQSAAAVLVWFPKRPPASLPAFATRSAETLSCRNGAPDADSFSTSWMLVHWFSPAGMWRLPVGEERSKEDGFLAGVTRVATRSAMRAGEYGIGPHGSSPVFCQFEIFFLAMLASRIGHC